MPVPPGYTGIDYSTRQSRAILAAVDILLAVSQPFGRNERLDLAQLLADANADTDALAKIAELREPLINPFTTPLDDPRMVEAISEAAAVLDRKPE